MFGVIVIGRNEGDRLKRCLESVVHQTNNIVYVDSGSTDNSVNDARKLDVDVISLDMSTPFTAARARNEGFRNLLKNNPEVRYVQFVDGDCELDKNWINKGAQFLDENPNVAVVYGRLRERNLSRSIYNKLCDIEWNTPVGLSEWCGGISLIRVNAFVNVKGFDEKLIAGEEPDMCIKMRKSNWLIWRLDEEMGLHDANIIKFGQWWKRSIRNGYAYALLFDHHFSSENRKLLKEIVRVWLWVMIFPVIIILFSIFDASMIFGFLIYPIQVIRIATKNRGKISYNWFYGLFMTLTKFPEAQGQFKYLVDKIQNKSRSIIEYK